MESIGSRKTRSDALFYARTSVRNELHIGPPINASLSQLVDRECEIIVHEVKTTVRFLLRRFRMHTPLVRGRAAVSGIIKSEKRAKYVSCKRESVCQLAYDITTTIISSMLAAASETSCMGLKPPNRFPRVIIAFRFVGDDIKPVGVL